MSGRFASLGTNGLSSGNLAYPLLLVVNAEVVSTILVAKGYLFWLAETVELLEC